MDDKSTEEKKSSMMGKVAPLLTGVVIGSGMVVAGTVLAKNKDARRVLQKGAKDAWKGMGDLFKEGQARYQTFQHRVGVGRVKRGKSKRGRH